MLRFDLCDYSDAYIVAKGTITVANKLFTADDFEAPNNTAANANATNTANDNAFGEKKLVFKNNFLFINCISKINGVKIDNAEDLDVAMPMYNLLNTVKIIEKQQVVCQTITGKNHIVVWVMVKTIQSWVQSLLITKQTLSKMV